MVKFVCLFVLIFATTTLYAVNAMKDKDTDMEEAGGDGEEAQPMDVDSDNKGKGVAGGSQGAEIVVSPESALILAECVRKYVVERQGPAMAKMRRKQIEGGNEAQRDYFLSPHFAVQSDIDACIKNNPDLTKVKTAVFDKTGFTAWIVEEKKNLLKEYSEIGKEGLVADNRGSKNFEKKGENVKTFKKGFRYWRRFPIPIGMALKDSYFQMALHLIEKAAAKEHGKNNAHLVALESMKNWLADEIANDRLLLTYPYHNYIMLNHSPNWKVETVDFAHVYAGKKKSVEEALENVKIGKGPAGHGLKVPEAKRIIYMVRTISRQKDFNKEKTEALHHALNKAFANIPISRIFVAQQKLTAPEEEMAAKLAEGVEVKPEDKFAGAVATKVRKNGQIVETAETIIKGKHGQPVPKIERLAEDLEAKNVYVLGNTAGDGDDDDLFNVTDLMGRILTELAKEGGKGAGKGGKHAGEPSSPRSLHKGKKTGEDSEYAWLASNVAEVEHIVLVGDLGTNISLQQVVDGKYKYAPQGGITQYVQFVDLPNLASKDGQYKVELPDEKKGAGSAAEGGASEKHHQQHSVKIELSAFLRLVDGPRVKHLGKQLLDDVDFMKLYWKN